MRKIGALVNQLMSRRGYAQSVVNDDMKRVIAAVIGDQLQSSIQVGNLRQGVLHVYASDSVTLQELNFQKRAILKRFREEMPGSSITDLRFRIQA